MSGVGVEDAPRRSSPEPAGVAFVRPAAHLQPSAADRAQALALHQDFVSRETWARLDAFVALLLERQRRMNLIGASTIPHLWTRHVADSLQLLPLAPTARVWADLGSGAGLPGLVIACALAGEAGTQVHLIESTAKKAAFLRDCVNAVSLPAIVHHQRIEDFTRTNRVAFEAVTARALAPLDKLLAYANPLLRTGAVALFPKGQDVGAELTLASKSWKIEAELVPSKTDAQGRIVCVRRAVKR
jgi:16S rRNA (guanine527-N7)-methyltransferase